MTLANYRQQWPVGQGGFHAARLLDDGELIVRYVVDCGAMSTYDATRDTRIDSYIEGEGGEGTNLDYLFITHAHGDHLNGVERLLDALTGMKVVVIVMPLLNVVDRLISYARTASVDPKAAATTFYRDFIVDPVKAVSRFGPEQIIQVRSSGPGGRAPFSINDGGPDSNSPFLRANDDTPRMPLKLFGSGKLQRAKAPATSPKKAQANPKVQVWVADDSLALVHRGSSSSRRWLLAPYVDPRVEEDAAAFMDALAAARKVSVAQLQAWLTKTSNVKLLLTHGLAHLIAAYHAVRKDLNVTSLSLYSGPVPEDVLSHPKPSTKVVFGNGCLTVTSYEKRVAWLGTGDAALKQVARRKAFFEHYGNLVDQVHTFVLPHHGSEGNFDIELLKNTQAFLCIAAADTYSNWRHPGTAVVQTVASEGRHLCVVTAAEITQVWELIELA